MSSAGCEGGEVGSEGAVELAGDEAFAAADDLIIGLAVCEAAVHVAAGSFAVGGAGRERSCAGLGWPRSRILATAT